MIKAKAAKTGLACAMKRSSYSIHNSQTALVWCRMRAGSAQVRTRLQRRRQRLVQQLRRPAGHQLLHAAILPREGHVQRLHPALCQLPLRGGQQAGSVAALRVAQGRLAGACRKVRGAAELAGAGQVAVEPAAR